MKKSIKVFLLTLIFLVSSLWGKNPISPVKRFGIDHLTEPNQIVAANGEILIRESKMHCIQIFSAAGMYKMSLGSSGAGPSEFQSLDIVNVNGDLIYCYDLSGRRIHLFSQKSKRFLRFIPFNHAMPYFPPHQMVFSSNGTIVMLNSGVLKQHKLIGLYNEEGKLLKQFFNAYPAYKSIGEYEKDDDLNSPQYRNYFKNLGYIAVAYGKLYFANQIENRVLEIDMNGKILNHISFPLPSHEKTIRSYVVSSTPVGTFYDTENELSYDMKSQNGIIYILCRDNGISYIFRLVNGTLEEACKMHEALSMFDIMDNKIYAIEEEPADEEKGFEVLVYDLPKN